MFQSAATAPVRRDRPRSLANIVLWAVQIAAAALFFLAGLPKLAGDPKMVSMFGVIGLGQWFRYLTGGLEVLGAVLLLVPALSGFGALLLTAVMTGAVFTHLFVIGGNPVLAIALLIASAAVAWGRREQVRAAFKL